MKKYIKQSTLVVLTGCLSLFSCKKALDINQDPNRLTGNQVSISNLLPSGEQYLASSFYNAGAYGLFYTQYLAGAASYQQNIDSYNPYGFDELWGPAYLSAMPNYNDIIKRADQAGAPQYAGIARTMMALTLMQCADIWGDIPYSEAFQGSSNVSPHYDSMQNIYKDVKTLLDQAIANLNQPNPTLPSLVVGSTDLIYGGNITKWKKAAYAARARYYINMSKKDPSAANYQNAIADANLAIDDQTGASDLQLFYNQTIPSPWFSLSNTTAGSRYARPSQFFVNLMNGNGYFAGVFDPRLPKEVDNGGKATYVGHPEGTLDNDQANGADQTNVDITTNTYYGQRTSPVPIITYSEVQFIKAEALLKTGDQVNAYIAYQNGIKGNMIKLGVATADMNTYLANPVVSKGAAGLTIADVMLQKYIALFLQMETWTDMRRYQYDPNVYVGLKQPIHNVLGNVWVQRGNYPDVEPGRNPNVPKSLNQTNVLWLFQ